MCGPNQQGGEIVDPRMVRAALGRITGLLVEMRGEDERVYRVLMEVRILYHRALLLEED